MKIVWRMILILSMLSISVLGASVKAVVDDPDVAKGNSVQLTIEAVGGNVVFPDIEKVGPYPVESRSRMSSMGISIINGVNKLVKSSKLTLTFTPDKAMTIPAFSVQVDGKTVETKPIDIRIVKSAAPVSGKSRKFSLDMVASKKKVYVGEPILLSVFFNESREADLMKVEYQKPETKDFFVKEADKERSYQKGNYLVHELRYILTPKYEGNFTIEPARARIAERGRRKDDFFGTFFDTPVWSRIAANSIKVEVLPTPENTDLVGDFKLNETIDKSEVAANKPVNLTITISGEGSLEDFEGPKYEIDGVTIYSDDAKIESHSSDNRLVSSFEKKYVFIADHNFTIPSRSFSFFDYKTGEVKKLETKVHHIKVRGSGSAVPAVIHSSRSPTVSEHSAGPDLQTGGSEKAADWLSGIAPWMLLLVFGAGVVFTLILLKIVPHIKWKRAINPMKESEALKILYPHINDDKKVEEMVRLLYARRGGDKSAVIEKAELKALVDRYRKQ